MSKKELLEKYRVERVKCDKWCRCMGYYRPAVVVERVDGKEVAILDGWNKGKMSEFRQRVYFTIKNK